jgi:hypothetical protein
MQTQMIPQAVPQLNPQNYYRLPWSLADNVISWLEVTIACNLACEGCYRLKVGGHKTLEEIAEDLAVFKKNRKSDCMSIAGGDPLVHPRIVDIVKMVKAGGWKPIINTNGLAFTPKLLKELKQAGVFGFTFHIDTSQERRDSKVKTEKEHNAARDGSPQGPEILGQTMLEKEPDGETFHVPATGLGLGVVPAAQKQAIMQRGLTLMLMRSQNIFRFRSYEENRSGYATYMWRRIAKDSRMEAGEDENSFTVTSWARAAARRTFVSSGARLSETKFPGALLAVNIMDLSAEFVGDEDSRTKVALKDGLKKLKEILPSLRASGIQKIYIYGGLFEPSRVSKLIHTVDQPDRDYLYAGNALINFGNYYTSRRTVALPDGREVVLRDHFGNSFSVADTTKLNPELSSSDAAQDFDGLMSEAKVLNI